MARRLPFPPCTLKPSASPAMPRHTPQAARRAPDRSRARTACSVRDDVRNAAAQMHHRRLRPQRDVGGDAAERAWRVVWRVMLVCVMRQHAQAGPALIKGMHVPHTCRLPLPKPVCMVCVCLQARTLGCHRDRRSKRPRGTSISTACSHKEENPKVTDIKSSRFTNMSQSQQWLWEQVPPARRRTRKLGDERAQRE